MTAAALPKTVADFLVERVAAWGVELVYGYSGDGINGILGAMGRAPATLRLIQAPHEELCALMATAHAKYTGKVGVCLVTQGPGAVHALNGLYDAKLDHQPVVAILGQVSRSAGGSYYQQEIDLVSLYKDVAHEFVSVIATADQARSVLDRAFRTAIAERTVTAVIVPHDIQQLEAVPEPRQEHGHVVTSIGYVPPTVLSTHAELARAAEVLNAGRKVALLVGAGSLGAEDEIVQVADRLGAGVAKALLGKAAVPDDLPFVTGSVGWLGTRASNDLMKSCDTLLIVGSQFPYTEFLPKPGQARAVQIDRDGRAVGSRFPTEVNLVGDAAATLRALVPRLKGNPDDSFRKEMEASVRASRRELEEAALADADPLNPARVFYELNKVLPDDVIIAGDCGTSTYFYAQYLDLRKGMRASLSGTLATMGSGIPYALAAKFNYPDRPALALVGDGAMQMNGINALISVAQHWKSWKDPRLVVLVLNNRQLSYVTWEQRVMEGDPKFPASQDLYDFPFARYAELLGLEAVRVAKPEDVRDVCERAFHASRPLIIEAVTDPNVPPLPPDLTPEQRAKLKRALSLSDSDLPGAADHVYRSGKLSG